MASACNGSCRADLDKATQPVQRLLGGASSSARSFSLMARSDIRRVPTAVCADASGVRRSWLTALSNAVRTRSASEPAVAAASSRRSWRKTMVASAANASEIRRSCAASRCPSHSSRHPVGAAVEYVEDLDPMARRRRVGVSSDAERRNLRLRTSSLGVDGARPSSLGARRSGSMVVRQPAIEHLIELWSRASLRLAWLVAGQPR
jgi:hypothetical protein